jgi:hypothetical protein
MLGRLGDRLTYANVVATLALFIALGGVSYAKFVLPANSVGKREIRTRGVGKSEIRTGAVGKAEAARNSIGQAELRKGSVDRSEISARLAASIQTALPQTIFVPKKSSDPCDTFDAPPGCVNVAGDAKSISFFDTKGWTITCPAGSNVYFPQSSILNPAFTVITNSDHYTGYDQPNGDNQLMLTVTNWSTTTHSFTPYIACV